MFFFCKFQCFIYMNITTIKVGSVKKKKARTTPSLHLLTVPSVVIPSDNSSLTVLRNWYQLSAGPNH